MRHRNPWGTKMRKFEGKKIKFGQLILMKIIEIVANRWNILKLKCTKFNFGWGSAPDPAGGAYSAPPNPLAGFQEAGRDMVRTPRDLWQIAATASSRRYCDPSCLLAHVFVRLFVCRLAGSFVNILATAALPGWAPFLVAHTSCINRAIANLLSKFKIFVTMVTGVVWDKFYYNS